MGAVNVGYGGKICIFGITTLFFLKSQKAVAFCLGHIGPRKVLRSFFPSYNVMISTHAVSRVFMIYKTGLRYLQAEQRVLLAAVTCTSNMFTNSQTLEIQGRLRSKLKDLCIYLQVVKSLSQGLTTIS